MSGHRVRRLRSGAKEHNTGYTTAIDVPKNIPRLSINAAAASEALNAPGDHGWTGLSVCVLPCSFGTGVSHGQPSTAFLDTSAFVTRASHDALLNFSSQAAAFRRRRGAPPKAAYGRLPSLWLRGAT